MASEFQLFDGKNLSSLFKDIYDNQQNKKKNRMIEDFNVLYLKVYLLQKSMITCIME